MKSFVYPLSLLAVLFLAGCALAPKRGKPLAPVPVDIKPKPTDYVIEAIIVDGSKQCRNLLFSSAHNNLDMALAEPGTELIRFPVLCVTPGTNAVVTVDNRKMYRYPVEFDAEGKALKFETRSVGRYIQARLRLDKSGMPVLGLTLEDSSLLVMEELKTPAKEKYERPICVTRQVEAEQTVPLKQWFVFSGGSSVLVEKATRRKWLRKVDISKHRVWRVALVKVTPSTNR